jgi:hypothetical protein
VVGELGVGGGALGGAPPVVGGRLIGIGADVGWLLGLEPPDDVSDWPPLGETAPVGAGVAADAAPGVGAPR